MTIDTKKVANRRKIHLADPAMYLAEIDRVAAAALAGKATPLGNWTVAQIFDHLAIGIEFAYKQPPFKPPLPIWLLGRIGKCVNYHGTVRMMMKPGVKLPADAKGLEPPANDDVGKAQARLRDAVLRLQRGDPTPFPNPLLGQLSPDQTTYMHLRHAEMHLSFVRID